MLDPQAGGETRKIIELTREIEAARRALQAQDTPEGRRRLGEAEAAYRSFLVGLNGLA